MTPDTVWNVLGVVGMVLLLGAGFMRRGTLLRSEDPRAAVLLRLRRVLMVVGALAIVATVAVLYGARHRTQSPFDLSPVPAQLDSLRGQVIADSTRLQDELHRGQLRDKASKVMLDGVNLAAKGRTTAALERYDTASRIDPSYAAPLENKGYALYRLGRLPEALATLRRALAMDAANPWTHYNYSLALWASRDTTRAVDEVEATLRLDPSFGRTIREDEQFRRFRASARFRAVLARTSP